MFRKVKYTVVRKLNRSQTRKRSSSHPLPYRFRFLVWPLKQTKNTLNTRINPSESVSVWLNSGMPLKRVVLALQSESVICHLQILIGVLYMQLIVRTAVVSSCFFVYSFVYLLIYYSLYISSLCVFVCICLFITTLISSYLSARTSHSARFAFAISEWLCYLFIHNFFLLMSLHFFIKSTIKIVVVV